MNYENLEDLIKNLEKIKEEGAGALNIPKALYILCLEIQKLKQDS